MLVCVWGGVLGRQEQQTVRSGCPLSSSCPALSPGGRRSSRPGPRCSPMSWSAPAPRRRGRWARPKWPCSGARSLTRQGAQCRRRRSPGAREGGGGLNVKRWLGVMERVGGGLRFFLLDSSVVEPRGSHLGSEGHALGVGQEGPAALGRATGGPRAGDPAALAEAHAGAGKGQAPALGEGRAALAAARVGPAARVAIGHPTVRRRRPLAVAAVAVAGDAAGTAALPPPDAGNCLVPGLGGSQCLRKRRTGERAKERAGPRGAPSRRCRGSGRGRGSSCGGLGSRPPAPCCT